MNPQNPPPAKQHITAVLIDTVSIQPYLFGSNKLKENIGASHIVGSILFQQLMPMALGCEPEDPMLTEWQRSPAAIAMHADSPPLWEIAYEGGGNAMLLFQTADAAKEFIQKFTLLVTAHFPGLRIAIGMKENVDVGCLGNGLSDLLKSLHGELAKVRHPSYCNNLLPKSGIMEDCPQSNEAATEQNGEQWIGLGTKSKLEASVYAQNKWQSQNPRFAGSKFAFTSEIEKLGQPEDKGYVAIVHIDGNGIGKRFQDCKSLADLRRLSVKVSKLALDAMDTTIDELVALLPLGSELREALDLQTESGLPLLPLRRLWMGGDDVVFVCEGRLGIYLASRFIHNFCKLMNADNEAEPISACAGVAIVKTKYPFYRAFKLAEDLMSQAKKASRCDNQSWLAWMISSAGFNGELDEILADQFKHGSQSLYGGPYCLDHHPTSSIRQFFLGLKAFKKWPRNKVMELRDVLVQSEDVRKYFLVTMENRGHKLPGDATTIDPKLIGTYMDMIEFLPFHLQSLSLCN